MKFDLLLEVDKKFNGSSKLVGESFKGMINLDIINVFRRYYNENQTQINNIIQQYELQINAANQQNNRFNPALYEIVLPPNLKNSRMRILDGLIAIKIASNDDVSLIAYVRPAPQKRFVSTSNLGVWDKSYTQRYRKVASEVLSVPKLYIINNNALRLIENFEEWSNKQSLIRVSDLKPTKGYQQRPLGDQLAEHFGSEFKSSIKTGRGDKTNMSGYKALTISSENKLSNLYFLFCTDYYKDRAGGGYAVSSTTTQIRLIPQSDDIKRSCELQHQSHNLLVNDNLRAVNIYNIANIRIADIIQSGDDVLEEYNSLVENAVKPKFIFKKLKSLRNITTVSKFDPTEGGYRFNISEGVYNSIKDFLSPEFIRRFTSLEDAQFKVVLVPNVLDSVGPRPTSTSYVFIVYLLKDRETGKDFVAIKESNNSKAVQILTYNNIEDTVIGKLIYNSEVDDYNKAVAEKYNKMSPLAREIFMRSIARS